MRINRDNYEEYFLLYADNELSGVDKNAVESFLLQNPDLAVEMEMLLKLRLRADENVYYEGKELLHHKEIADTSFINSDNYSEYLLSYTDNELNFEEKKALEDFLSRNPQAKQELEILEMAKLEADPSIVFEEKSILYKTTRVPSRWVIPNWTKVAVAAAVILVAGFLWIMFSKDELPASNQELSQKSVSGKKDNNSSGGVTNSESSRIGNNTTKKKEETQMTGEFKDEETKSPVQIAALGNSKQKNENRKQVNTTEPKAKTNNIEQSTLATKVESKTRPIEEVPKVVVSDKPTLTDQSTIVIASDINDRSTLSADVKTDYASEALLRENLTMEPGPGEETQQKKGMFRGLIRKANRVFNKVTNPEPGRPVVRVANFELALAK